MNKQHHLIVIPHRCLMDQTTYEAKMRDLSVIKSSFGLQTIGPASADYVLVRDDNYNLRRCDHC